MSATPPVPDEPMAHDRMVVVDAATLARLADNEWDRDVTERCIVLSDHPERLRRGIAAVQAVSCSGRRPRIWDREVRLPIDAQSAPSAVSIAASSSHGWVA
ncbi:hypothetical protein ACWKWA_12240 [Dermacoccus abyssi]